MATKSYKLQLDLRVWDDDPVDADRFESRRKEVESTRKWLNETRKAFNTGTDYLISQLLRMHRGTGVCREEKDGVWREWKEINSLEMLLEARTRHKADRKCFSLLENRELLNTFLSEVKSEAEAVELAECCRIIAQEICPPSEDSSSIQMPRSDLDLLTDPGSEAKGIRPRSETKTGAEKKVSGKKPGWILEKAIVEESGHANSLDNLCELLSQRQEFQSAKKDGKKRIEGLRKKYKNTSWQLAREELLRCEGGLFRWQISKHKAEERRISSETSGAIRAYKQLFKANCLPPPGFAMIGDDGGLTLGSITLRRVHSEWKYAMWNMAGQRVRSHLGWVRRRAAERMLWELQTTLFERGGWIRARRNGKPVRKDSLTSDDIRFERPSESEVADFEHRPPYANREWVKALRTYETDEIPKYLEGVAFGAAGRPCIRRRTAKGWARVRDKWIDLLAKANKAGESTSSVDDLLEAFDQMRSGKPRDFGDRRLFEWLAAPERRWFWDGTNKGDDNDCGREDRDTVTAFITHNEHFVDKPDSITFTRSDPVKHPVWPFFGENSAVKYWLTREQTPGGRARLVLVLKQLLARQPDGSYSAVDDVKIALRGYEDFERSFAFPDGTSKVSPKQPLVFRDDLLGGQTRQGTLSGMKLIWERDELEASNRKHKPSKKPPRVYANFSCNVGEAALPEWLTKHVGSNVKLTKPRDGMIRAFFLKKTISKDGATDDGGAQLPPGQRQWPKEAITNGFAVRGTDLGLRVSSAGAWWRLSFTKPDGKVVWQVGTCESRPVFAVLERTAAVSLPGDGEPLPEKEQALRERLRSLRTRLNLNNALLRIARLLTLEAVTQRKPNGDKTRRRSDGTIKRIGTKWEVETRRLDEDEIKGNCRKAAEQLLRWASTDVMKESLKAIGRGDGSLWEWLESRDGKLEDLGKRAPTTIVPTEKEAKAQNIDRNALKVKRKKEDDVFTGAVYDSRTSLAKALCDDHHPKKRVRAKAGLWFEFDAALLREVSYSNQREQLENGLLRLLRKPPVTKHNDRKDEANNLPHGKTHRGGLSMSRLNFLDDVKNFVRRWSCRPRWPGDVRRIAEGAKFDRSDTEHLDHLREHRAKLIAHSDVAQALGFEQDLRRGLWRFRTASGELLWHCPERGHFYRREDNQLIQCSTPERVTDKAAHHPHPALQKAHILVYEDLTRYKMRSDRPKNENAGLAQWSHRRILAFSQHIGGLFGVPVATVDARFSSRYCSRCGAPGCRAVRFDPAWLEQAWFQRIRRDTKDQSNVSRNLRKIAQEVEKRLISEPKAFDREQNRPWVLRDGGSYFVCANPNCRFHETPINADENAAANIGLRFLRGIDGIRATLASNGAVTRSIGYMPPGTILAKASDEDSLLGKPYWHNAEKKHKGTRSTSTPAGGMEDDDESGEVRILFRDPSGGFCCPDRWFEGKAFWGAVAQSCAAGIKAANASHVGSDGGD